MRHPDLDVVDSAISVYSSWGREEDLTVLEEVIKSLSESEKWIKLHLDAVIAGIKGE